MVAVPGRSKGCATCRRRKIRCDLQEPYCGQCIKSSRHCEGFRKEIAFIHRTPQGYVRKAQEQKLCRRPAPWASDGRVQCEATTAMLMSQMPQQVNSAVVYLDRMFDTFLVTYLPSSSILSSIPHSSESWLKVTISHPGRGRLLSDALQALCLTRLARVHGDKVLLMQGITVHGQALRALQSALYNTSTALADETLAAMRVLATYEMYEGTMGSMAGWTSHEEAAERLLHMRGFKCSQYETELGKALLAGARKSAMIRGIQFYKATFLGEESWCTEPWGDKPKDYSQQLLDIGLLLPAILEDLSTKDSDRTEILQRCQRLSDRFNSWHARLLTLFPSAPYWALPVELVAHAADIPPAPFSTAFSFLDIRIADVLSMFWALRICLYTILRRLSGNPKEHDAAITACACNIAKSAPYLTVPKTGFMGMQLILFPLKVALSTFQHKGWDNESQWSREVLEVVQNRGIRYVGDVVKAKWGERIRTTQIL